MILVNTHAPFRREGNRDWELGRNLQIGDVNRAEWAMPVPLHHLSWKSWYTMTTDTDKQLQPGTQTAWVFRPSSGHPGPLMCHFKALVGALVCPTMETWSHTLPKSTDKPHDLSQFPVAIPTMTLFTNRK